VAKQAIDQAGSAKTNFDQATQDYKAAEQIGDDLAGIGERRIVWAELLKAVNDCLPKDDKPPDDISLRNIIYVDSIDSEYRPDLTDWKAAAQALLPPDDKAKATTDGAAADAAAPANGAPAAAPDANAAAAPPADASAAAAAPSATSGGLLDPPANGGWIVMIRAHHYHNHESDQNSGAEYVRGTLLKELREKDDIQLADVDDKGHPVPVSTKELGIDLPVMLGNSTRWNTVTVVDPFVAGGGQGGGPGMPGMPSGPGGPAAAQAPAAGQPARATSQTVGEYPFVIEFAWKPTTLSQRQKNRRELQQKKAAEPEQPKMAAAAGG
jgi:hypothetical protein